MRIFPDCLLCMLRQVVEASRMAAEGHEVHEKVMDDSLKIISEYKKYRCSPDLCRVLHHTVKKHTGVADPYRHIKERDIKAALELYPQLRRFLEKKGNSLYWALKTAATGNIIDSALYNNVNVENCVKEELEREFSICDMEIFEKRLRTAKRLLIIGDNAGETVFDRILAEHLQGFEIFYAVRSEPIINDVTLSDAYASGLDNCTKIVSTGCNVPGAILEECSAEFTEIFHNADIVISKGLGNHEALSDQDRGIFFLLKAKCPVIAQKLGVALNDYVFKFNGNTAAKN